jgi:hypothetical protein
VDLAGAIAKVGDPKPAANLFEQAREVAKSITDPNDKAFALEDLAGATFASGCSRTRYNLISAGARSGRGHNGAPF